MKKPKEALYNSDINAQSNPADQDELLNGFDKERRSFLKRLLISTAYVTPAILTFSIADLEAGRKRRRRPTRNAKKRKSKKK
jgi:hypothetical protein